MATGSDLSDTASVDELNGLTVASSSRSVLPQLLVCGVYTLQAHQDCQYEVEQQCAEQRTGPNGRAKVFLIDRGRDDTDDCGDHPDNDGVGDIRECLVYESGNARTFAVAAVAPNLNSKLEDEYHESKQQRGEDGNACEDRRRVLHTEVDDG